MADPATDVQTATIIESLAALATPIDQLVFLPGNPRRGDVEAVARSLKRFGQRKPVTANRDGTVTAGNHTLAAARLLGWTEIAVAWTDDDEVEAKAWALADNHTGELGTYDDVDLAAMLAEVQAADADLYAATSWTDQDLNDLLASLNPKGGPADLLTDPDDVPDLPTVAVTTRGDVWLLGPHRVMCGDSITADDVATLTAADDVTIVFTDPPYGIAVVNASGHVGGGEGVGTYRAVLGDESTAVAVASHALLIEMFPSATQVWWGANHYVGDASLANASCWLVWDKENNGNFADAELAWTNHPGAVRLFRHMWDGYRRASERGKGVRVHPTQKPVALAEWAFTRIDPKSERSVVLDVFGGSGSTLIACQRASKIALLMELDPLYVDVICRRFQEATGIVPVLESTGKPHDFTTA